MNAITKTEQKPSLIAMMAAKHNMDPDQFAKTVRATVMPAQHTNEQFAALMLVANEYGLNPVVKEIYAFPAKGGGIVPVVSIDGWLNLINSHPQCDGFETDFADDENGNPVSCTCRMYRKDRSRPVTVVEYFAECSRNTDPWKMKHRMLRHKAVIQAARYAFGFAGIYDEDEGAKIAEMRDITPQDRPQPPKPPVPPQAQIASQAEVIDAETGEITDLREIVTETSEQADAVMDETVDDNQFFTDMDDAMAVAGDAATIEEIWDTADALARFQTGTAAEINQGIALAIKNKHLKRVGG